MINSRVGRMTRGGRLYQRSQRKEPEEVKIDLNAPLESNLNEVLRNLVQTGSAARGYLRPLVKLAPDIVASHHRADGKMGPWSSLDIVRCVRVFLVDGETEVRSEALRVLRHLTASESMFEVMRQAFIPPLVVKSLDIVLDNKVERLQALRLMRRCASVAPQKFPLEFVHSILAVANDGAAEKDNFAKACVATAAELCVVNPRLWLASGAFMMLVRSVLSSNVSEPRAAESLVTTMMFLVNDPTTRQLVNADLGLEYLISPFTDRNFEVHPDDQMFHSEREMKARVALCSVLRSWPGLIYLCSEQSGLTKLIELLRVPDTETQRSVMDLFFDLFCLQTPEWTTDFRIALLAADDKTGLQRGWLLYEGFVAAEAGDLIPPVSRSVNLSSCYLALLLQAMVMHGLLDAVAQATVGDEEQVSIHATVLLAELLHMCSRLFPHDASHMCHLLPGLIDATISPDKNIRLKAVSVINRLAYIEQYKCEKIGVPTSLSLDQQFLFCQQAKDERSSIDSMASASPSECLRADAPKRRKGHRKSHTPSTGLENLFANSGLFNAEGQYDWDNIKCLLKQPGFEEDPQAGRFLDKLLAFYIPSNRQFSAIETEREQARNMCTALLVLADFCLERASTSIYIDTLISDVCNCLKQIQGENIPPNSVLSPAKASSTLGQAYFLLIGRLTGSVDGLQVLNKFTIFEQLTKLLVTSPSAASMSYNDVYIKLALSPLNYTHPGPSRTLFRDVITLNRSESARLYCVQLLRMLIRCRLTDMSHWVIELLVQCLHDESSAIKATAYEVLNEACDVADNLDALIALDPQLPVESEDLAWMLQLRYFSRSEGLILLESKDALEEAITRWRTLGSIKYVKWVEDTINQSVSRHRRSADGKYGRRYCTEHKLHRLRPAFCPPHLLGQLASSALGIDIIKEQNLVEPLCETIRNGHMDTPTLVLYVKAALWAVGHLCKTRAGLRLVQEQQVLEKVVELARTANVLSLRGTAFYCLCLVSVTGDGCDALSAMGWEGVRLSTTTSEFCLSRRSESIDSQWSLDSSWTSSHEFRDRAGSAHDSISFDDISLAASDVLSAGTLSSPPHNWTFADMRKMMHCYTSQADATGYGTLKRLRPGIRNRSVGEAGPTPVTPETLSQNDDTVCMSSALVGLVLPRHISSIFNRNFLAIEKSQPSKRPANIPREIFGSEHKLETCFRCGDYTTQEKGERDAKMAELSDEANVNHGISGTETRDRPGSPAKITRQDHEQARNDLLRYVINLATVYPNSNKAIEQLLLSMKQKQPWVFNDLCLLSDCFHLMRIFQLKQPFRKFLQELFMDTNFGEFRTRARLTVQKVLAKSTGEAPTAICEDNEKSEAQHETKQETHPHELNSAIDSAKAESIENAGLDGDVANGVHRRVSRATSPGSDDKEPPFGSSERLKIDDGQVVLKRSVPDESPDLLEDKSTGDQSGSQCGETGEGQSSVVEKNTRCLDEVNADSQIPYAASEDLKDGPRLLLEKSSNEVFPQDNDSQCSSMAGEDRNQNDSTISFAASKRRRRRRKGSYQKGQ
ncbi:rapamycin-insensitive companion of mTOR-like [Tropilaelaps mercedesae]|uniref:Rapamycin-insensitive companion of mTOR-like n=1 Tax=Tropilaelaps mercedesae TaxID=418985 RepID=A0A1V9XZL2_9ACAR|nr:rapamycin-insensitive companion of mTOR-like [Tropilaelaps mercedesae]